MSAKKGSEQNSIVVGGVKKNRVGPRARLASLGIIAAVVIVLLGVGGWLVYNKFIADNDTSKIPKEAQDTRIDGQPLTDKQRSEQAIYYGEYEQGQEILEKQLKAAPSKTDKIAIYMQLAGNALNAKHYDEADSYLQEALLVDKAPGIYSLLAQSAATQGDKKKAVEYANLQKKALDPAVPGYSMKVKDIDEFIKEQQ